MKQNVISGALSIFLLLFCGILFISNKEDKHLGFLYELPQLVKPPKLVENIEFAGEKIPINEDTRERLERELLVNSYHHTSTVMALKLAPKFFPMIEKILKEENVPDDFKYLAVAESNLSNATSPASAKGLWQFLKGTALDYGLEVSTEVDERFHYEKSTKAAAKYLKFLYNQTGSWSNAAAAYNMGLGNLNKTKEAQKESSFYDLNLNEETSRYLFRIAAIKEIISNPEKYGFYIDNDQKYMENSNMKTIQIQSPISNLSDIAHQYGISYRILKYYNPWLIDTKIMQPNKTYMIKIPNQ